jgi:glycine/D-amino acid oxidase-like deaminating enzyme
VAIARPLWSEAGVGVRRSPLEGDLEVDVAVVGAGFSGLWAARELLSCEPSLRVAVLEAREVGFGASGRNGGWCSGDLPVTLDELSDAVGRAAALRLQLDAFAAVDGVGAATAADGIECDWAKEGSLVVATNPAHVERLRAAEAAWRRHGVGPDDVRFEPPDAVAARVRTAEVHGGLFHAHCAVLHPRKLVDGLARAVESRGGTIHEGTPVSAVAPGVLQSPRGRVRAGRIIRATEAYGGRDRRFAPLYSLMVATEPLRPSAWEEIGWSRRVAIADGRNMVTYAQRTADGRIAFGGRGAPYHLGSRVRDRYDAVGRVHRSLAAAIREMFPAASRASITHEWGGALAAPRDWRARVVRTGDGVAVGGYVGDGVALSYLAGRTAAHAVLDDGHELLDSPLLAAPGPRWEPEPLRWAGINGLLALTSLADAVESRTRRPARRLLAVRDAFL